MKKLKNIISFTETHLELMGWEAQKKMSPPNRIKEQEIDLAQSNVASVLFLLYEENEKIFFPLTQRNRYEGVHSGQISFPGGKKELMDENLWETAVRETKEELGLNPDKITYLKTMTPLYIPPSNFLVHPFMGYYQGIPQYNPDEKEVQNVITVEFDDFLELSEEKILIENTTKKEVPAFIYKNYKIWGATAMMLNECKLYFKKQ